MEHGKIVFSNSALELDALPGESAAMRSK